MSEKTKKRLPIIAFIIGAIVLAAGIGLFIYKILAEPAKADAEFLVSVGKWVREDTDNVVWEFTEIGQGGLTTDNFLNTYNFIWSIEDGKLKIETDWLYDLGNEFEYKLDQGAKTLTVRSIEKDTEIHFKPL